MDVERFMPGVGGEMHLLIPCLMLDKLTVSLIL